VKKKIVLVRDARSSARGDCRLLSARKVTHENGYYAGQNTAVCTDRMGNRVPDNSVRWRRITTVSNNAFLWYYLGRSSAVPYYGHARLRRIIHPHR
jgi:hypothetical protein